MALEWGWGRGKLLVPVAQLCPEWVGAAGGGWGVRKCNYCPGMAGA